MLKFCLEGCSGVEIFVWLIIQNINKWVTWCSYVCFNNDHIKDQKIVAMITKIIYYMFIFI